MASSLVFVLAPEPLLPGDGASRSALAAAQRLGIAEGTALRLFRVPAGWEDSLDDLVGSGAAGLGGSDPFAADDPAGADAPQRLFCDAVIPRLDVAALWLGVYAFDDAEPTAREEPAVERPARCLDRFALSEAQNETCWFYPTEDGVYLAWRNPCRLQLLPGLPTDGSPGEELPAYRRDAVRLLWSLMADDPALTCVGLTYRGRRIEWATRMAEPDPSAAWTAFRVDSMADVQYCELSAIAVFAGRTAG